MSTRSATTVNSANQNSPPGLATVLAGLTSFKDLGIPNIGDTYRGQILLASKEVRSAIIKDIPQRELANEILIAALASALSLPVPDSFLAIAAPEVLKSSKAPKLGTSSLLFASTDVSYPSVAQLVLQPINPIILPTIAETLLKTGNLASFYSFDSWSANIDRHVGNILLGSNKAWLIDHGHCFTGATWKVSDLAAATLFRHRLKEWLTPLLTEADRKKLATEAAALALGYGQLDVGGIGEANHAKALFGDNDFQALVVFLKNRVAYTPSMTADALNQTTVL